MIVLRRLMRPPFEPMNMASLADMTRKLAFLLTLASAKRNSEVWAFRAVVRFGQAVVSAKSVLLKKRWTRVSQRPLCTCHDPLHPSMGEDLPVRFFCAPSKKGTEILSQTKHKRSAPEQYIGSGAFNWAHRLYIQADGVRVDQTSDHTRLTRRVRMRIFLT